MELSAPDARPGHSADAVLRDDYDAWYMPRSEDGPAELIIRWPLPQVVRRVVLKENILLSQRVERFAIDWQTDAGWREACTGTVIGYKKIAVLPAQETTALRIRILDARCAPTLSFVGVYA